MVSQFSLSTANYRFLIHTFFCEFQIYIFSVLLFDYFPDRSRGEFINGAINCIWAKIFFIEVASFNLG